MLELFLMIWLCGKIGLRARSKGLSSGLYKFFVVLAWFGGQVVGGVVAFLMFSWLLADFGDDDFMLVYLAALFTAGLSVWFVFKLVAIKPDYRRVLEDFDDDEDDRFEDRDIRPAPNANRGDDRIIEK